MPVRDFHQLLPVERWSVVRMVEELGLTHAQAAAAVNCTPRTIDRVIRQHTLTGDVTTSHGGGREHAYSPAQMRRLDRLISQHRNATAAGLRVLMGPSAPQINDRTMRRYRRDLDYTRRRQGISVEDTPRQHELRVAWARQHATMRSSNGCLLMPRPSCCATREI